MRSGVSRAAAVLHPLSEFYRAAGVALPEIREIPPSGMPEPYRRLLVHERDMTPTLEAAWGGKLRVRALRSSRHESVYMRQSLLLVEDAKTVTAMGAISIDLDRFPEAARRLILEQRLPLGGILRDHAIQHHCRPSAYFEVRADSMIGEELGVDVGARLYGRQNVMWDSAGFVLAEVIEILPPATPPGIISQKSGRRE